MNQITLVVVDDHPLFRQGVVDALSLEPDMRIIPQCGVGDEALEIIRTKKPTIAVLDVNLPGMNGQQITHQVSQDKLPTRIILMTGYDDIEQAIHRRLPARTATARRISHRKVFRGSSVKLPRANMFLTIMSLRAANWNFGLKIESKVHAVHTANPALRSIHCPTARWKILTAAMLDALAADGLVARESIAPLGQVLTGVAVRGGEAHLPIATRDELRRCFAGASALYCPDTARATAGIHFVKVLDALGLWPGPASRLREHPSGAVAMRALAGDAAPGRVGCTQVTEILYTPGVELVGVLPEEFRLATTYSVAVAARSSQPDLARRFARLLTAPQHAALRERGGFVPLG